MHERISRQHDALAASRIIGAILLTVLSFAPATSRAQMELIPSVGLTKSTDDNADDAKFSGGLALRAAVLPFLKLEGGISYRQDAFFDDALKVRLWPVTASAWLTPFPMVYAGGGIGWYRTTYDFEAPLLLEDRTTSQVGLHVGGGLLVPVSPKLGLDINGRYIFMQADDNIELPTEFNPDFWNATVGLSFQF